VRWAEANRARQGGFKRAMALFVDSDELPSLAIPDVESARTRCHKLPIDMAGMVTTGVCNPMF
jgi:hypothetical protein